MSTDSFKEAAQQRPQFGVGIMYPAAGIIESIGAGWDWIWLDTQHGQADYSILLEMVRTSQAMKLAAIVRPASHEQGTLGRVMDMAPDGLIIPQVDTVEQAQKIVSATRFPPLGDRSYGGRRVIDKGGRGYYQSANEQVTVLVQIESPEAIDNAEAIASVDGIDGLFFGPDDVKMRLGLPIDSSLGEPQLAAALESVSQSARSAGKLCGCVAVTQQAAKQVVDAGYRVIVATADVALLRTSVALKLAEFKPLRDQTGLKANAGDMSSSY